MKIKKPTTANAGAPAAAGGAAIADRFKINGLEEKPKGATVGAKSAACALVFGLIALTLAGILTWTLWKHWEFLMPA